MSLKKYIRKRNFKETKEPVGGEVFKKEKLHFVVQRHKATRLHYDFRLEAGGVLKSWAVPKGPSMNPADKRLAILVEDHPIDYRNFKGTIPKGNYGAGIVEIWDTGYYSGLENASDQDTEKLMKAGLKAGNLKFQLHGKKLKGEFALVKIKGGEENAWLLIKHKDQYATSRPYNSETLTPKNSPINKWKEKQNNKDEHKAATHQSPARNTRKKSIHFSNLIKPMLAYESDKAFDDPNWVFEIKWDGYRAICSWKKGELQLYSRNGKSFNQSYPMLLPELKRLKKDAVLDGEIVALNSAGIPDFQLLQNYEKDPSPPLHYYVFDLLFLDKTNTCNLTLLERKSLLKILLGKGTLVKYCDHVKESGKSFFKATFKKNLEGMMAKKTDSLYYPGQRTENWLKIKHHKTDEFVIAGYTKAGGSRKYFGALVLAKWKKGMLAYSGHSGSGFSEKSLADVYNQLQPYISHNSPFKEKVRTNAPVVWLKPHLVCEVKFTGWTQDGKLRHPIFLRLRQDKTQASMKQQEEHTMPPETQQNEPIRVAGQVTITHADKLFWPGEGITKENVVQYYQLISGFILPYLKDRPESLKRNPNGILDKGFYQKDMAGKSSPWAQTVKIHSESAGKDIHYILCNNKNTMAFLNNLGCIEFNPWHSRFQSLDRPDYLVLDIDPGEKNTFDQVIEVAQVIHDILERLQAPNFCKTSGATGMHVFIPAARKYSYDQLKEFSHLICVLVQEQLSAFTTLERNLAKRGKKHIYLDYLQNRQGQTIASAYSLRPYPGATVSRPLLWKELNSKLSPHSFNIHSIPERLKKKGDLFSGILGKGIDLRKCLRLLDH